MGGLWSAWVVGLPSALSAWSVSVGRAASSLSLAWVDSVLPWAAVPPSPAVWGGVPSAVWAVGCGRLDGCCVVIGAWWRVGGAGCGVARLGPLGGGGHRGVSVLPFAVFRTVFQWLIHSNGSLMVAFPGFRDPLDVPYGRSDHLGSHTRTRNYIPPLARPRSGWLCSAVRSVVAFKSERGVASFGGRTVKFGFRVGCRVNAISHPLKCRVKKVSPFG